MNYYIFKTNHLTGETMNVSGGRHDNYEQCAAHFRAYCYGFMDGAIEICGAGKYQMMAGHHGYLSFIFSAKGLPQVEYFMLLDAEGWDLMKEICNKGYAPAVGA